MKHLNKKTQLKNHIGQLAALICVIVTLCCFIEQKEGYHMDELLSFELANAEFNPWIVPTQPVGRLAKFVEEEVRGESFRETLSNLTDVVRDIAENQEDSRLLQYKADVYQEPVWISAEQFHDYLTVGTKDCFNYLSVYFNVKDDNHPPLHFMLLHTMSSLFRDTVAPYLGCFLNLLAVMGCCVCFFALGTLLEGHGVIPGGYGRMAGICACLLYGLSAGGIASVLLIRMYALMTFFCVAFFYLHVKKWLEGGFGRKNKVLVLVTVCGFLTQYFFLFYCLVLAAVTAGLLISKKRHRELENYVRTMIGAAVIGLVLFPFAVQDVFSSGRGQEALQNLGQGLAGYGSRISAFGFMLVKGNFGNLLLGIYVLVCGVLSLCLVLVRSRIRAKKTEERRTSGRDRLPFWLMLWLPCCGYFLLAARMSPYLVNRYIMPLFPFAALGLALMAVRILGSFAAWKKYLLLLLTLLLGIANVALYDGSYLYRGYERQMEVAERYQELPCICIYDGLGYYYNLMEFTQYEKTLLLTLPELADRQDVSDLKTLEQIVVLKKGGVEEAEALAALGEYGWEVEEELLAAEDSVYGDTVYLCTRGE